VIDVVELELEKENGLWIVEVFGVGYGSLHVGELII